MSTLDTIEGFARALARHPYRVLVAALVVSLAAALATARLPIRTSRKALFPKDEPVLKRLDSFIEKFGSTSDLLLVIEGAPREVLEEFATLLVSRLKLLPEVGDASARLDTDFFFARSYLMVPQATLEQLSRLLDRALEKPTEVGTETVTFEGAVEAIDRWLEDPPAFSGGDVGLDVAREALEVVDTLLQEWLRFIEAEVEPRDIAWERLSRHPEASRFLAEGGFFATRDGRALVVFVSRKDPSSEFNVIAPFIRAVQAEVRRAQTEFRGQITPQVGLTGLPAIEYEEYVALQSDIVLVVSTAAIFIILLVFLWMRSLKRALVVFIPMGLGTLWNMGLTLFTVGHLTLLTAAFTAILFGLGVDYGIFLTSRILEEIRPGEERTASREGIAQAIGRGTAASARGIVTAGCTTVLIFLSLVVVPFQGFRELGIVAATGVLLVLAATFVVSPALMAVMRPGRQRSLAYDSTSSRPRVLLALSRMSSLVVVSGASIAALIGLGVGLSIAFNYDVLDLLPTESEAARLQRRLVAESDFQPEVLLINAPNLSEARRLASALQNLSVLSSVQSVVDLFPVDGEEKAAVARKVGEVVTRSNVAKALARQGPLTLSAEGARRLADTIKRGREYVDEVQEQAFSAGHERIVEALERIGGRLDKLAEALSGDSDIPKKRTESLFNMALTATRKAVSVLEGWREARPLSPEDLPESLRNRFFASDGSVALYAYPRFSVYNLTLLDSMMDQVLAVAPQATGFPATHRVLSRVAVESFRLGSGLALLVALLLILVLVRSVRGFITSSLPLVVGVGWMLGLMAAFGMEFNYANIVGAPMVMALAVDYGVWFTHRRRELSHLTAWESGTVASQSIFLAAGTTLAGLGAIMLAQYRGVSTMGACVTLGLVCCFVAARVVSVAVAHLWDIRRGHARGLSKEEIAHD